MAEKSLVILRGLPGSGKSTLAKLFNAPICCADDYLYVNGKYVWTQPGVIKAHALCEEKCKRLMISQEPLIIIANMCVKPRDMRPYTKLAEEFGYRVFSVIVENRHEGKNEHNVSEEMLKNIAERFQIKLM